MGKVKKLDINYENLSEEKLRLLHLRGLATGEIQGPPTGYPDVDMPWLAKQSVESVLSETPKMTIYQYLYENNKDRLDNVAIRYFGEKITYREVFEKIDDCAKALLSMGMKKGDVLGIAAPTTPESIYMLYAANKIGVVINVIDLRKSNSELKHEISEGNTKSIVIFDEQVQRIGAIAQECGVKNIISLPPTLSLPTYKQALANTKQFIKNCKELKNKNRNYIFYDEFIERRNKDIIIPENEFNPEEAAFLAHTSGTTGMSKTVALSDGTVNNVVRQYMNNGMERNVKDEYLSVIPIFLVFGISLGIHMSMSMGMETNIIPAYDIYNTEKLFRKNSIEHTAFPPSGYVELIESKRFNQKKINSITLGSGADGISPNLELRIIEYLINFLTHGYGGTEVGSAFSTEVVGEAAGKLLRELQELYKNKKIQREELREKLKEISDKAIALAPGSSGIPLPGNNVMIVDHETGEKLRYGEVGDIIMIVEYPMIEYLNNQELTSQTKVDLGNGKYGIKLNDAGYVTKEGYLFVKGRFDDVMYDSNNEMIWPIDIENVCYLNEMLRQCAAVNTSDNSVKVFVTKRRQADEMLMVEDLNAIIKKYFPTLKYEIEIIDKMPLTSNGKVNRKELKKEDAKSKIKK